MTDPPLPPPPSEGLPPPPPVSFPPPPAAPPPPGYVAHQTGYGYAAGPHASVQALSGLATTLTVLFALVAAANVVFALTLFNRASVLETNFDFGELADADNAVGGGLALVFFASLPAAIVWIIWQYRHAKNAQLLGKTGGLGPGWAVGGWFIPFGAAVIPELELVQSARASDPDASAGQGRVPGVVYVWWALFVLQGIVALASGRYGFDDSSTFTEIGEFQSQDRRAAVGSLIAAAAAIAAIVVARTLSARQRRALQVRGLA